MGDCVSRNPLLNATCHYQNAHRVPLYPHFGTSNNEITELQAHLPFLVGLASLMCNIESHDFDSN
jgi:hypothetical protein